MRFEMILRARKDEYGPFYNYKRKIGMKDIREIRNYLKLPKLEIKRIKEDVRTDANHSELMLILTEEKAVELGLFEETNKIYLFVPTLDESFSKVSYDVENEPDTGEIRSVTKHIDLDDDKFIDFLISNKDKIIVTNKLYYLMLEDEKEGVEWKKQHSIWVTKQKK